ncbi:MAG: rhodanese-like domain-containing protein [Treponema sp.]|nr:rhodanese-like domain-containing protein [Treponema sp.]
MKKLSSANYFIPFGFSDLFGKKDPSKDSGKAAPRNISPKEAKAIMDGGKPYTLLDVRTEEEFRGGHIKGALLIPDYEIEALAEKKLPDKNAVLLVYCQSGARSARASRKLAGMGYTNVNNFGGIMNWPYDIING